jgi:O-antigen/teichoic acid export membrane protein
MAEERYDKILWLRLVNSISMLAAVVFFVVKKSLTLDTLLWINFLSNCLTSIVGIAAGMSRMNTLVHRSRERMMEIFHFGKFSLGTTLVSNLLGNVDVFVLEVMLGPAAIAIYNIPIKFMQLVEIPLRSFIGTGMSGMAIAFNNKNPGRVKEILTKYSGMMAIAFIPMAVVTFFVADYAIYLVGAAKYAHTEAANLLRIFMLFSVLSPIDRFNGATLDVIHKPNINLYKTIVMLVVNVGGDFLGIAIFHSMYGVVFGSTLTLISGIIFGYFMLRKYLRYTIGEIFVSGYHGMLAFIGQSLAMVRGRAGK